MSMIEDFIEQLCNAATRLTVSGKWEGKEEGLAAGRDYAATHKKDGWEFDSVTAHQHPKGWWSIEVSYRRSIPGA